MPSGLKLATDNQATGNCLSCYAAQNSDIAGRYFVLTKYRLAEIILSHANQRSRSRHPRNPEVLSADLSFLPRPARSGSEHGASAFCERLLVTGSPEPYPTTQPQLLGCPYGNRGLNALSSDWPTGSARISQAGSEPERSTCCRLDAHHARSQSDGRDLGPGRSTGARASC